MRILLIHNFYQDPGGEDVVFEQEYSYLSEDHEVDRVTFQNKKGWKGALQFLLTPYNVYAGASIKKAIRKFKPDLIHIHNLHYAIGPICIRIAHRLGIPIVFTLHNYRLICPSAILYHGGKLLLDSIHEPFPWTAVRKGTLSHSVAKTFWVAASNWAHRKIGTFNMVGRYIVLTPFAESVFQKSQLHIPQQKFTVKPNFISPPKTARKIPRKNHFLFVGRLTEEKGIQILLNVFKQHDWILRIAGDGPMKDPVLKVSLNNPNIEYLGVLNQEEVLSEMAECTALLFPSVWYEGMPMTIIQALSRGTPIIASKLGAMETMIQHEHNGLLFLPNDVDDLQAKIGYWLKMDGATKEKISQQNILEYHTRYDPVSNKRMLLDIYKTLVNDDQ